MARPFKLDMMDWSKPSKRESRLESIIEPYRKIFGRQSIPRTRQYWSMCGDCVRDGKPIPGHEIDQLTKSGLIKPSQFYGVEIEKSIYKCLIGMHGPHWFNGDFQSVMEEEAFHGRFNPSIIFFDNVHFARIDPNTLPLILDTLIQTKIKNVLVVANFILKSHRQSEVSPDSIFDSLVNSSLGQTCLRTGWFKFMPIGIKYNGTGNHTQTIMCSVMMYNKSKS